MIRLLHREQDGSFLPVAWIDGMDLDFAYRATQNGALSDSWSQWPPAGVRPIGIPYHLVDGRKLGRRSSMVGDRFELRGKTLECGRTGFAEMPTAPTGMTEADVGPEPAIDASGPAADDGAWQEWACKAMAIRMCGLNDGIEVMAFHLAMETLMQTVGKLPAQQFAARAFPIGHGARQAADLALDIQTLPVAVK